MSNLYEVLGLPKTASPSSIRKKYRKLAMRYHPDRNQGDAESEERYRQVTEAYEVLSNPARRAQYDRDGSTKPFDTTQVDRDVLIILHPILINRLRDSAASNRLRTTNLVDRMQNDLDSMIAAVRINIDNLEKGLAAIQPAAGRFSVKGGPDGEENLLEAIVRDELRRLEGEIALGKKEYDRLKVARDYLCRCLYAVDGAGDLMKSWATDIYTSWAQIKPIGSPG